MDYGARMYDAQLGRWGVIDPLCESYHKTSTYAYCKNNPIFYKEIDGRYFTQSSWDSHLTGFINDMNTKEESLNSDIGNYKNQLASGKNEKGEKLSDKDTKKLNRKLEGAQKSVAEIGKQRAEIAVMENSDQKFEMRVLPDSKSFDTESGRRVMGETTYGFDNHAVILTVYQNENKFFAHELKHGYQFLVGEIVLTESGSIFLDEDDENRAYDIQSVFGSTDGSGYGNFQVQNLSKDKLTIYNQGWSSYPTSERTSNELKKIAVQKDLNMALHISGITYEIKP